MRSSTWLATWSPIARKCRTTTPTNLSQTTGLVERPKGREVGAYQRPDAPKPRYGMREGSRGIWRKASAMSIVDAHERGEPREAEDERRNDTSDKSSMRKRSHWTNLFTRRRLETNLWPPLFFGTVRTEKEPLSWEGVVSTIAPLRSISFKTSPRWGSLREVRRGEVR